jgi:hypothetical protein
MSNEFEASNADRIFRPVPDELRRLVAELKTPPDSEFAELPEWARKLVVCHSRGNLDRKAPSPFALEASDGGEDESLMIGYEGVLIELLPGGLSRTAVATPKTPPGGDWMHKKITDYWDTQVEAIEAACRRLEPLGGTERTRALTDIEDGIGEHVRVMSDEWLIHVSVPFADDLYKAANRAGWWGQDLHDYLVASGGTFSRLLADRGIQIQYLVDNQWPDPTEAIELFSVWFGAAGFSFVCPQDLAQQFALRDGARGEDEVAARAPSYAAEARRAANAFAGECQELGGHFMLLDTDSEGDSWDQALERRGAPGVVTIYRNAAPEAGSKVAAWFPEGFKSPAA